MSSGGSVGAHRGGGGTWGQGNGRVQATLA